MKILMCHKSIAGSKGQAGGGKGKATPTGELQTKFQ